MRCSEELYTLLIKIKSSKYDMNVYNKNVKLGTQFWDSL